MNHPPPSDRTPAPGGPPVFNRSLSRFIGSLPTGAPPTTQKCKTNPIYSGHTPKTQNEPNSSTPTIFPPRLCETNPICPTPTIRRPKNAKRTLNKTQAAGLPPLYLTPTEVGETPTIPKNAKQTQFRVPYVSGHPTFYETNPIYRAAARPLPHLCKTNPIYHPARKSPVRARSACGGCPKRAKRTQFTPPCSILPRCPKVSPDLSGNSSARSPPFTIR